MQLDPRLRHSTPSHPPGVASDDPRAELDRLRHANDQLIADNARLAGLAHANAESARLQADRAAALLGWAARSEATLARLHDSTFWHLTAPLRVAARMIGGAPGQHGRRGFLRRADWREAARAARVLTQRGARSVKRRVSFRLRPSLPALAPGPAAVTTDTVFARAVDSPAAKVLAPRVLIIAELTVPQCAKYRVWQKRELFRRVGVDCAVTDWRDTGGSLSALQVCASVIFYRAPGTREVLDLIKEARRLGVPSRWEVDDAIFDEAIYAANKNLDTLDPAVRENLLAGVRLYRAAMLACDGAIASTADLAVAMQAAGVRETHVVENALDTETLEAAEALRAARLRSAGTVRIIYGSGTKTHDADFACAAPALARLLRARPEIVLQIVGELALPPEMDGFADRIERMPPKDFRTWLGLLANADIALAPLEDTAFNDAKSNIKFLEAAILGVPCVCSPRANFRSVVVHGETGMLADDDDAWFAALDRLAAEPSLRARIGDAGRRSGLDRYAPDAVARHQVAPLIAGLHRRTGRRLRILSVNVFFWPRSFGGATIVAEEVARLLNARADAEVYVFTSHQTQREGDYGLRRYDQDGMPIISVALPGAPDDIGAFDNPAVATQFSEVLRAVEPDVVHIHSIQGIGTTILQSCRERSVPYVVTVHDAWWLCVRQFMVRADGRYCFQKKIDLNLCRACVPEAPFLAQRLDLLLTRLREAALVLSPSRAHASLYAANGIDPDRLRVQSNGIRMPSKPRPPRPPGDRLVRFGYVGGTPAVKGFALVRKAFEDLPQANWRLTLIDNTLSLGFASIETSSWQIRGEIVVRPAYRQDEMDDFFAGIDVLLFPSQWLESFGLTVREALARDVWVIATDCGGPVEDMADGVNGTIVPMDGRHEKLRDAIAALLDDPDRLAGYHNPHKDQLRTFAMQAEELFGLFSGVAAATGDLLPASACSGAALEAPPAYRA